MCCTTELKHTTNTGCCIVARIYIYREWKTKFGKELIEILFSDGVCSVEGTFLIFTYRIEFVLKFLICIWMQFKKKYIFCSIWILLKWLYNSYRHLNLFFWWSKIQYFFFLKFHAYLEIRNINCVIIFRLLDNNLKNY